MRYPRVALNLLVALVVAAPTLHTGPGITPGANSTPAPIMVSASFSFPESAPAAKPAAKKKPKPVVHKKKHKAKKHKAKKKRVVHKRLSPKTQAKRYAASRLSSRQYRCLVKLWNRESGWRHTAYNRSSGAYGIPQSLPGSKMRSAGRDWRTNPVTQVKWGLGYIRSRYGSPCGALSNSNRRGWY